MLSAEPFVPISMSVLDKLIFVKILFFSLTVTRHHIHIYINKILELAILKQATDTYRDRSEKFLSTM